MLCQVCKTNSAEIKITHVINNKKLEINLCKKCSEDKGVNNPLATLPQIFSNFLAELVGDDFLRTNIDETGKKCSGCGSTWRNFQKTGLFGCDICYQTFEDDLNLILRRIHGSNQHIGSRPKSIRHEIDRAELDKMKIELENAIKLEKFERAAELRDLIRDAQDNLEIKDDDGILR